MPSKAERVRSEISRGTPPAHAAELEGIELFDLRGAYASTEYRSRAYVQHNEYAPMGSHWYYDARDERNRDELASSVQALVDYFVRCQARGDRPSRIYVDNYGGAVVAPLEAAI